MPKASSRQQPIQNDAPKNSTRPWQALKKHRWQLITASALLAIWVVFLVAMALYN